MSLEQSLILEPNGLRSVLGTADLLVVDLGSAERYAQGHIPGAVHLDYSAIVLSRPPIGGLLPGDDHLSQVLSSIGLTPDTYVVAYDSEGGGKASRLLWTLDVLGHQHFAFLNGGLRAWMDEERVETLSVPAVPSKYSAVSMERCVAEKDYILSNLNNPSLKLLDCRSPEEYAGSNVRAARGGHIPGAVNMNWLLALDDRRNLRLKPQAELRRQLGDLGVTIDKEVITYCHTHHRSSHTYIVLKSLGYERVKGYPGSWSEWGNLPDTPVETGSRQKSP